MNDEQVKNATRVFVDVFSNLLQSYEVAIEGGDKELTAYNGKLILSTYETLLVEWFRQKGVIEMYESEKGGKGGNY